jgi:hypothetical protein
MLNIFTDLNLVKHRDNLTYNADKLKVVEKTGV